MVNKGLIQAICSVLESRGPRSLVVALEGINFILRAGKESLATPDGKNPFLVVCEETGVIDKIEQLQLAQNQKVYEKAIQILEEYFVLENEDDIMQLISQPPYGTSSQESTSLFGNVGSPPCS